MKDIPGILRKNNNIFRPVPFWSWNERLDPEFLKWQIAEMARQGLGGFFMHARGGLETAYLGEEWMECVKTCIEEGGKAQIDAWMYDEVGWPSGFAGGVVTAMGDAYHARKLSLIFRKKTDSLEMNENTLGLYVYRVSENTIHNVTLHDKGMDVPDVNEHDTIIEILHTSNQYYVDVLNPKVIRAFMESTHERYYKRFKDEFGKGLKGFFTDEPRLVEGKIPWSYTLPKKFVEKYGYDLIRVLPLLFIEAHGYEKVRHDFWSLVSMLFTMSYMKQIYDWCEEHHCQLTGHVMMEESLYSQMKGTSGSMPFYEYMHIPGVDWLRRSIGNPIIFKQASSVARQLGREKVLTETYALCGWDISFEEMKWMAESQYVNGINLMCQHLQGYSLKGRRKRDYPPSLFFQQPWWDEYAVFNEYLARLGALLALGRPVVHVAVLHPMRSAWIAYNGENNASLRKLDKDFLGLCEILAEIHVDFDFADETILEKYGRIENGKFVVGQSAYSAVIMPSMLSLGKKTMELLSEWVDMEGDIFCAGEFPEFCDGGKDHGLSLLRRKITSTKLDAADIRKKIDSFGFLQIRVTEKNNDVTNIRCQQRDLGNQHIFFMINQDKEREKDVKVEIFQKNVQIERLKLETNTTETIDFVPNDNGVSFDATFLPMQSFLFISSPRGNIPHEKQEQHIIVQCKQNWEIESMELNALTIDACRYRTGEGDWYGPVPVIKLMEKLVDMRRETAIEMEFDFIVDACLKRIGELFMVMETPGRFRIIVNGNEISYRDCGWWKDSAFKKVEIKKFILKGKNTINLKTVFQQDTEVEKTLFGNNMYESEKNKLTFRMELESIYVVGDFGVISESGYRYGEKKALHTDGPFRIVEKPAQVTSGDLTPRGFCFFSGNIVLTQDFEMTLERGKRICIDFGRPDAVLVKVHVNDKFVKTATWAPFIVDITEYVINGKNKLSLQLFSGNRNLLGPHHHVGGEPYNVGPDSFTGKWSWVERVSEADPDILEADRKKDLWSEGFWFVKFGLGATPR